MSCSCRMCNAREFFEDIHYKDGQYSYEPEVEPEEPKSVWERLSKISDELDKYGAPPNFINELNDICDELDSIDSELHKLQKDCIKRTIDYTQFKLGEISKKLY